MKKISLIISFLICMLFSNAQRFFYVEGNHPVVRLLQQKLMHSAQFVVKTPIASDYIINTSFEYLTGADVIKMNMNVKDSVSLETIFRSSEEYSFAAMNKNTALVLRMAVESFLEKNLQQVIHSANADHYDGRMKYLKPRKDKT
jgi:hypothetical protein